MDPRLIQAIQLYGYDDIGPAGVRGYVEDALSRGLPISSVVGALASGGGDPARFQQLLASQLEVAAATDDAIARTISEAQSKSAKRDFAAQQRDLINIGSTPSGATTVGPTPTPQQAPAQEAVAGGGLAETLAAGGFSEVPGRPGVYVNAEGKILDLNDKQPASAAGGVRGFAPQAKSTGTLPNGVPYLLDPNAPPGQQAYNAVTGELLSATDFAQLPQQATSDWGTLLLITPDGQVTDTGQKIGFGKQTPQEQQADAVALENMRQSGQNARQTGADVAANQREELRARTTGFTTAASLVPTMGTLALNQAEFNRDLTTKPSDFVARAFASRGEKSPFGFVSQADLANQLSSTIQQYNQSLAGFGAFNPSINTSVATQPTAGFTAPVQATQQAAPAAPTVDQQRADANRRMQEAGVPSWVPGFSGGTVVPGFAVGTGLYDLSDTDWFKSQVGFGASPQSELERKNRLGKELGIFSQYDPMTGFWYNPASPPPNVGVGYGRGGSGFTTPGAQPSQPSTPIPAPQIPQPPTVTQGELQAAELQARPPAISRLLSGQNVGELNLGFQLPSAMNYQRLTPDEKTAFGTTLATQYNVSTSDFEKALSDRYGFSQGRQAVAKFKDGTKYGFTTEPMFMVGEESDGELGDTGELVLNPKREPIAVISNKDTKKMGFKAKAK